MIESEILLIELKDSQRPQRIFKNMNCENGTIRYRLNSDKKYAHPPNENLGDDPINHQDMIHVVFSVTNYKDIDIKTELIIDPESLNGACETSHQDVSRVSKIVKDMILDGITKNFRPSDS